jgi:hypothetical protein
VRSENRPIKTVYCKGPNEVGDEKYMSTLLKILAGKGEKNEKCKSTLQKMGACRKNGRVQFLNGNKGKVQFQNGCRYKIVLVQF